MNLFTKQKKTHRHRKKLMATKGERAGGINWELGINRYTLLHMKQIHNKDLLYNTRDYIQYLVITYNGKESESLCCTLEINTTL